MLTIDEALQIIDAVASLDTTEKITLNVSLGRVLAQDIIADSDQPPFHKSAMDGYACRREDLPGPLALVGQVAAGSFSEIKVETGNCVRIFTGAPVPDGANCVIMQENVTINSNNTIIFNDKETKNNICYQGEDLKKGDIAIYKGTIIKPQHIAVMASFGITEPLVAKNPKVAIICSGSELVEPSAKPSKGMIRNSNAFQLLSQLIEVNAEATYLGIIPDVEDKLIDEISKVCDQYDVVIVTGGASAGDFDFMPKVLSKLGAKIHFSELNIQPGKPIIYSTIRKTHLLALSGNPVSSFLQFLLIVKPIIFKLTGATDPNRVILKLTLEETIRRKKGHRQLYVPISISRSGLAKPVKFNGSAHIAALNGISGFAIMEPGVDELHEKDVATILFI